MPLARQEDGLEQSLDLAIHGDELYIAMAGIHEIWRMRLDDTSIGPYAGNGREDMVDGPLFAGKPTSRAIASLPSRAD